MTICLNKCAQIYEYTFLHCFHKVLFEKKFVEKK
jgi:hypothetical protein